MHVKLLGQFRQGLLTLDGSQRYFRLEHRRVVAAGSSRHGRSCSRPYWPPSGTKSTYPAVQFSRATSEFYGSGVWHCPYCDGYEHRDQQVAVYGRGGAVSALALELTGWTSRLTVVSDGPCGLSAGQRQRLKNNGIEIREDRIIGLVGAEGRLTHIVFASDTRLDADAMFFPSRGQADLELARGLGVQTTRNGTIRTRGYGKTGVPGVFIAGDASRHVQLAVVAAGEGAAAAFAINTELLKQDLM